MQRAGLVILMMVLGGCLQPASVRCASGRVCPAGTTCKALSSTGAEICASADELAACAALADGAACLTNGNCHEGVCLHACGDRVRTGAEQCDGTDLGSAANCTDLGYYESSELVCSPSCTYDVVGDYSAGCKGFCGDGTVNGPELCEDVTGWTDARSCVDFGLDAGAMGCARCGPSFGGCKQIGLKPAVYTGGSIHGSARDDAWIVSVDHALHFDGKVWTTVPLPGFGSAVGSFHSVWAESSARAWAAGAVGDTTTSTGSGVIAAWDGTSWKSVPVTGGGGLSAIWAGGNGDAWAVGASGSPISSSLTGVIVNAHGGAAQAVTVPAVGALYAIWGSTPSDIWAVGQSGAILHYNGTAWAQATSPVTSDLRGIYGDSATNVWAVGQAAVIHFDGTQWRTVTAPPVTATGLETVWVSGSHVWVGGYECLFEYDGSYWMPLPAAFQFPAAGLWGSAPDDVWALVQQNDGLSVGYHYSGATWARWHLADNAQVSTIFDDGKSLWATVWGFSSTSLWRYLDGAWAQQSFTSDSSRIALWGSAPDDLWAIRASIQSPPPSWEFDHFDGATWTPVTTGITGSPAIALWGSSANDVWAVGATAGIWHSTGAAWTQVDTTQNLVAIWGTGGTDVWAAGYDGRVLHYNGSAWSQSRAAGGSIAAIWGTGPSDVWAVGDAIYHYDGAAWTSSEPWPRGYSGVGGTGPKDVFAVGGGERILRWDGTAWNPVRAAYNDGGSPYSLVESPHGLILGLDSGSVVALVRDVAW